MQFSSSPSVSDSSLAALPQPAPLAGAPGELAAEAPGPAGGFEALIATLVPSATPRPSPQGVGQSTRLPVKGGCVAKPGAFAASAGASVAPASLGRAAVASFFGADAPVFDSGAATLNEPAEPVPAEERRADRPETSLGLPEVPAARLDPLPPLALPSSVQSTAGAEDESPVTETLSSADSRERVPPGSLPSTNRAYSPQGDDEPMMGSKAGGETQVLDPDRGDGRVDAAGSGVGGYEAATERSHTMRPAGIDRVVGAVTVALAGPAGEVAAGVPFSPNPTLAGPSTRELTNRAPDGKEPALRAVQAAAAKFAGVNADPSEERPSSARRLDKTFLTSERERVTIESTQLGTSIANLEASMISRFANNIPSHPGSEYTGEGMAVAAGRDVAASATGSAEPPVSSAHEAVEAVLNVADRMISREQRSVDLSFTVGEVSLAVRVELHGGEVRTSFRTDSPELQAALAEEWDARGSAGDKTLRFAAPVITGSDSSGTNDTSGRSPQHQEREARRLEFESEFGRREPARVESAPLPALPPTNPSSRTSHRLLSFA